MPEKSGRSGWPGNSTEYKPIHIHTAKPELLQPGKARATKTYGEVSKQGGVPGKSRKFNYEKKKGVR